MTYSSVLCTIGVLITVSTVHAVIPTIEIAKGVHMPLSGVGTWLYNSSTAEHAVATALKLGYTSIDTANDYGNQDGVGRAIAASGRSRKSIFLTTKVGGGLSFEDTAKMAAENLKLLGVDYVDLLLTHFPTTMEAHPKGSAAMRQEQWRALEAEVRAGRARAIGVSHFCKRHMQDILDIAVIKPAINQVEFHVGMGSAGANATDDRVFAEKHGITYQSFSPLCGPCGEANHLLLIDGPLVTSIGKKYNKTGAQISLKWQVQQGIPVIPKSNSAAHLAENIDLFDWELTKEDMDALTAATTPPVTGGGDNVTSGDCGLP